MDPGRRSALVVVVCLVVGVLTVLLAGCEGGSRITPPAASPTAPPVAGSPTAASGGGSPAAPTPTPQVSSVITLTVWTTEAFSPTQTLPAGQVLAQEIASLGPDIQLRFVLKRPYGEAGILDYLLVTGDVVPDLLPDLTFLDVDELGIAVQRGLVQPLTGLLPAELLADLYPFAREACTFGGRLYGLQFQADLDHLVYNPSQISNPPRSWPDVLQSPGLYLFPAGGDAGLVNDAFWVQYLAIRTEPGASDAAEPFLEELSLVAVLQFYRDGLSEGVFPPGILDYHTSADSWRAYLASSAAMAQAGAQQVLSSRDRSRRIGFAAVPTINRPGTPLSRGWALVLITDDPIRQRAALEFMVRWLAPEVNAAWNMAAATLPTREAALGLWDQSDPYVVFLREQLREAEPRPRLANYGRVAAALQRAVEAVLNRSLTPEEAAARALKEAQQ